MKLGDFDITLVDDGLFGLDGGSMFGVVPRPGWERLIRPDDRNRIDLALRVVLVRGRGRVVLLDAGAGNKIPERLAGLMNVRRDGGTPAKLAALGIAPGDVTDVVLTHLHFDHAGGVSTLLGPTGAAPRGRPGPAADRCALALTYPAARVHVQRACWEWAQRPTEKDAASFMAQDIEPLRGSDRLCLAEGDAEILSGVSVIATNGHTPGMQVVVVGDRRGAKSGAFAYLSDLVPTVHHLKLPYIMAFDTAPLETLAEKKRVLADAVDGRWVVCFGHDTAVPACTLVRNEKGEIVAGDRIDL